MKKARILVVDDNRIARRMAGRLLEKAGFELHEAQDGPTGIELASTLKPDLILLDCVMPQMHGIEVLRRLREHFVTSHVPVVMLTSLDAMDDRVEGLSAGADDYITKPFDKRDLLARVEAALRRSQHSLSVDPLTKLPGNIVLRKQLVRKLEDGLGFSVTYVDIDNFKAYVDNYGFHRAGQVIQTVAQLLHEAVRQDGDPHDFIGHIGGDDFLLLAHSTTVDHVAGKLIDLFAQQVVNFYSATDYNQGFIPGQDRYGTERQFPLLSLSVAIIDVPDGCSLKSADLAAFAGQCKQNIKRDRGCGWKRYPYLPSPEKGVGADFDI